MERITAPIVRNDRGAAVENLQDGLIALLTGSPSDPPDADRRALIERLAAEQRDGAYRDVTTSAVARFQRENRVAFDLPIDTGEQVDEATADAMNRLLRELGAFDRPNGDELLISGRVEFEDGTPAVGFLVSAFDRDLGSRRTALGDPEHPSVTGDDGAFPAIRYRASDVAAGEGSTGASADLVFEVHGPDDRRPLEIVSVFRRLATNGAVVEAPVSDLVLGFAASTPDDVRIVLAGRPGERGLAEFERLMLALAPLMSDGSTPADFDQQRFRDVDFSAREIGWDRALVETLTVAWQLARSASREPSPLAETFYGLLRRGAPTEVSPLASTLGELLDQDARWASKLEDSLAHAIVGGERDTHLGRLRDLRTDSAVRAGDSRTASVGDVLARVDVSEADQRALLGAYEAHAGTIEAFWRDVVSGQMGWPAEKIRSVQTTLQLADVLSYDLKLLERVQEGGVVEPRELVGLGRQDWVDLVTTVGPSHDAPGATDEERIARTVDAITSVLDATYPTESVARLARSSSDPKLVDARDLLARFFEREQANDRGEGFDIRTSPVTAYLETHGDRVFDGLEPADRALLASQLQRLQRVFRLGVDRAQSESLLTLGLDSAFHITRFSPEHFVSEFGDPLGGAARASLAYGRAEKIAGTVLYLYTELWQDVVAPKTQAMMSASQPAKIEALKALPTYRALFGNASLCDCGHCQSFYSPAAYFVDLLHMLDRKIPGASNPVDVLFARRPDLAHIQLTCENTDTLIPYVDLVTEVLEGFVANGGAAAFNEPPPPPNRRLASPSAEELRVNPVALTAASAAFADQAYAALQDAVFPLSLPLNLPLETARAYLDRLGTTRAELMELFERDAAPEAQIALAAEILRLSPEEFEVLTGASFDGSAAPRPASDAELFGLSTDPDPLTRFNHSAPELVRNVAKPDDREASIRSLQNVLGVVSATPIPVTGVFDVATESAVNALLTSHGLSPNGRTDAAFWGALEADGLPSLSVLLSPVPFLLERSGLSYAELLALVSTRFVNPTMQGEGDRDYLERLGIPAADVSAWIRAGLPAVPAPIQVQLTSMGEDPGVFTTWVTRRARAIVVNTSFGTPCDLDLATLMHLDGTLVSPDELVELFRFVRLWRKLAWTLAEVDLVVEPGSLESAAVFATIHLLANVAQLREQTSASVADTVSLWQSIPTHGERPLYDQLFRNRAAQSLDPVLELDRERTEIKAVASATPPNLADHLGPILAAFRLSAQDLDAVLSATGLADDLSQVPPVRRPLTLATLSSIYREVALARALRISVGELLALVELSGLAVFERPDRIPRGAALELAALVEKVRDSGVTVAALDYLCRAAAPPHGVPGARREELGRTLAALVDGLSTIASEEPIEHDPAGDELTARLTTLVGPDDARQVTALVYGTDVYTATLSGLPAPFAFPPGIGVKIAYDVARKQLRYRGAMTAGDRALLLGAAGVPASVQTAYLRAIEALAAQPRAFVARALASMYAPAEAEAALVDVPSLGVDGVAVGATVAAKIDDLLVRRRAMLSRALIKQTFATATGLAADVVALVLEDDSVLTSTSGTGAAMSDYLSLEGDGLDAAYFGNPDLAGVPSLERTDASIGFDPQGGPPAPGIPAAGFSVRWTGSVYVPLAGEITFHVRCSDGVRVTVNGALVIDEWRDQPESEFTATARLDGGQFYAIEVEAYHRTGDALLELGWSSPSVPAGVIPPQALYTAQRYEELLRGVERISKVALLVAPFALTAHDVALLARRGDLALDTLSLVEPVTPTAARAMFGQWMTIAEFASLRDRYSSPDVAFVDVPSAATADDAIERFSSLAGAPEDTLRAIVDAFDVPIFDAVAATWSTDALDLTALSSWKRIADALDIVSGTGAAPDRLAAMAMSREIEQLPTGPRTLWRTWTARDADGNDRRADGARLAQGCKNLLRARFDDERWRAEATDLNDVLRIRRRSALTAFVLATPDVMRARVSDSGRLFEYLLIDVEMDPCMQTSRIKQGISSVQLFVQRVLLDLESPLVPPARVDGGRWEWMQAYRVWEANRKVFLYAESYVEEDLRDDKTPIFKEFESDLLQDALDEPNAERAFRRYLEKLDDVAKLVVCGTCVDDAGILHVFGRTATTPFVFYHRQLDATAGLSWTEGVWSPWEKLAVDVATVDDGENSGAALMPIVWNRRLYLFWPELERKPDEATNASLPDGFDQIDRWQIKLAWSEYKDGRWSPKRTGVPVLVSNPVVRRTEISTSAPQYWSVSVIHHPATYVPQYSPPLGAREPPPGDLNYQKFIDDNTKMVLVPASDTVGKVEIGNDDFLNGTKLDAVGDWALHRHDEASTSVVSLVPKPVDHYLDAATSGAELSIRVFCRFRGFATGQFRTEIDDTVAIVRSGQRTDRKEHSQKDGQAAAVGTSTFELVGTFHFPSCAAEVDAVQATQTFDYSSLERPEDTTNSFMALRREIQGFGRIKLGLRLRTGADPVIASGSLKFEVIDSDNRSGFDRSGPFFYQDRERCYLVTRETYAKIFDTPNVFQTKPDARASMLERAVSLSAIDERRVGLAPESSPRTNPWAHGALMMWAAGPGLPASMRLDETTTATTLPGSYSAKSLVLSDTVKDQFGASKATLHPEYTFTPHWHPYTCPFLGALNSGGLDALFTLDNESRTDEKFFFGGVIGGPMPTFTTNNFETIYKPDPAQVVQPYPLETVDFSLTGSYSKYNWEIFFHAPMTVAMAYSRAGEYRKALRWFHFSFFPTIGNAETGSQRFWRFLPFRDVLMTDIATSIELLSYTGTDSATLKRKANFEASIREWLDHPFDPHAIARRRPAVYMKYVFMKYLDNLIAWADDLFQRDTIESINEATQLYVLAANLLGPQPKRAPSPGSVEPETYQSLRGRLDALSNAQVDLETRLPFTQLSAPGTGVVGQLTKLPQTLYFCLPQNDGMLAYWDTIADRLFKIRHCMSFDGTVRQLPLFEPPIDPMLLVEAVAHGLDIGSVLADLYAPLPRFRFTPMLQQALAMCNEVRSLGSTLLTVLEKRDVEALSALRAGQETQLLDLVKATKKLQIDEAEQSRQALDEAARVTTARMEYFENLLAQGLNSEEIDQLGHLGRSNEQQEIASLIEITAHQLNIIPNVTTGSSGGTTFGGSNLGSAASAFARSFSGEAAALSYKSARASITGGHTRRAEEWRFQRDQAKRELKQIERQSTAARIRREIAESELRTQESQLENARGVEEMLRTKFTNADLYGVMTSRISAVYYQAYKAAYELAKSAERCWCYERGTEASFIKYGAWDSSVRGLLAGEQLLLQLKQMERAQFEQQVDELEITKHVSVVQLDPLALIALKETGACEVEIPEWVFDLDYPGNYFRRLKTVSVTIPAVVGPYTSMSATLTLLGSKVRESGRVTGDYGDDENYRPDHLAVRAIAVSTGQNDSGRFALDLRDEKYLPFEGAGAISRWRIELPSTFRSFDYDTISDIILQMRYTARHDGLLADKAVKSLEARLAAANEGLLLRMFSLRHEFPNEWEQMRASGTRAATFRIPKTRFPLLVQGAAVSVAELHYALVLKVDRPTVTYKATLTPPASAPGLAPIALEWPGQNGRYRSGAQAAAIPVVAKPEESGWGLQITSPVAANDLDQIKDILIVARYSADL